MPLLHDIPGDVYRSWPGVHSGLLNEIARSPAHARHYQLEGRKDTPALCLGRKTHYACLEPDKWREMWMLAKVGPMTKAFQAAQDANPDRIVVTEDQQEQINAMTMAVWDHPEARRILSAPGGIETCAQWTDAETGLPAKVRLDKYTNDHILADLKTTLDASPRKFMNAAIAYGYHRQAAWYRRGYREATGYTGPLPFRFIAVEKAPPFVVAVYEMSSDDLDCVDRDVQRLLRTWAECVRTDNYPGYGDECRPMPLPEYALVGGDGVEITYDGEEMKL